MPGRLWGEFSWAEGARGHLTGPSAPSQARWTRVNRRVASYLSEACFPIIRFSSSIVMMRPSAGWWTGMIRATSSFNRSMFLARLSLYGLGGLVTIAAILNFSIAAVAYLSVQRAL